MDANSIILDINFVKHIIKCFDEMNSEDVETRSIVDITVSQLKDIVTEHEETKTKDLMNDVDQRFYDVDDLEELFDYLREERDYADDSE